MEAWIGTLSLCLLLGMTSAWTHGLTRKAYNTETYQFPWAPARRSAYIPVSERGLHSPLSLSVVAILVSKNRFMFACLVSMFLCVNKRFMLLSVVTAFLRVCTGLRSINIAAGFL